jgi:hypothetical protein
MYFPEYWHGYLCDVQTPAWFVYGTYSCDSKGHAIAIFHPVMPSTVQKTLKSFKPHERLANAEREKKES